MRYILNWYCMFKYLSDLAEPTSLAHVCLNLARLEALKNASYARYHVRAQDDINYAADIIERRL